MKTLTTIQKIDKLNEACNKSLCITCYGAEWEISSYEDDTPLCMEAIYPRISDKTFKGVVDKAYKFVFSNK